MIVLRIQHAVPNFDAWKHAFESDPMDRRGSGVRRYRIYRATADPNLVMIDLEFDKMADAETFLVRLRQLWAGPGRSVAQRPEAWIIQTIESKTV